MQKKLYSLFVLFLLTIPCFSQSKFPNEKHPLNKTLVYSEIDSSSISTDENKVGLKKLEKLRFPSNQKNSPEVFYVIDDKPVSREEYLRLRKNK